MSEMKPKIEVKKVNSNIVVEVVRKSSSERIFDQPFTGYDATWFSALDTAFAKAKEVGRKTVDVINL